MYIEQLEKDKKREVEKVVVSFSQRGREEKGKDRKASISRHTSRCPVIHDMQLSL